MEQLEERINNQILDVRGLIKNKVVHLQVC